MRALFKKAIAAAATLCVAGGLVFALAGGFAARRGQPLRLVGSTSVQPFAEMLAEEYNQQQSAVGVQVEGGGSTAGFQAVTDGFAHIGMSSRELKAEEVGQFHRIEIARDGIAVVVHPDNPVTNLTCQQVRDIFAGRITNWNQIPGVSFNKTIWPITREEGSGTREAFFHLVMGKDRVKPGAITQESNGAVRALVRSDVSAIGYMSLGVADQSLDEHGRAELKKVAIDGVQATRDNVYSNTYKLHRPFLFVYKGELSPEAQKFVEFVLSKHGQEMLEHEGLIGAPPPASGSEAPA